MKTFEMNGKAYETDAKTLKLLKSLVREAKKTNDFSAVIAVMDLGEKGGRIRELKEN